MALSVSVSSVKAKCRITVSDFDTEISNLISEQLPAIEFSVLAAHIADTGNAGLQSTLNLGAAEIIAGEFLAQAFREPGSCEWLSFGDVTLASRPPGHLARDIADPYGLKAQGWERLRPYLKPSVAHALATRPNVRIAKKRLTDEESERW